MLGVVVLLHMGDRQVDLYEFKGSTVYKMNSRPVRATQWDSVKKKRYTPFVKYETQLPETYTKQKTCVASK